MKRQRWIALALALCLSLTALPMSALAAGENDTPAVLAESAEGNTLKDELTRRIRSAMVEREGTVVLTDFALNEQEDAQLSALNGNEEAIGAWLKSTVNAAYAEAYAHTGVPNEGDYLKLCVKSTKWSTNYTNKMQQNSAGEILKYFDYTIRVTFTMEYYDTAEQEQQVEAKLAEIMPTLKLDGKTDLEKVAAIYDYITRHVSYDDDYADISRSAYGALVNGKAVCQGYCVLLYRMCLEAGVDCRAITGQGTVDGKQENHGWNIVKLGNLYYNADATWDAAYVTSGWNNHYFLTGDGFYGDHTCDAEYTTAAFQAAYPMSKVDFKLFSDVKLNDWCFGHVQWAVANNVTGGTSDTTFAPDKTCTRAEVVQFLYNAEGKPDVEPSGKFTDVPANEWYAKAVAWAVANNVTSGTSDTTFAPDKTCTRAEVVQFLYNYQGKPETAAANPFVDVGTGDWFSNATRWAVEHKITSGTDATHFSPDNRCTRAEVVTFLHQYSDNL